MGLEKFIQLASRSGINLHGFWKSELWSAETYSRIVSILWSFGAYHRLMPHSPPPAPRDPMSVIQPDPSFYSPLQTQVLISAPHHSVSVSALLDSGSAGNFISSKLCNTLQIPKVRVKEALQVHSITGKLLNRTAMHLSAEPVTLTVGALHEENITLLVLENSTSDIILGRNSLG
ncbi:MAG: retropepsin-like aspartic protease [Cetobacterium sp.]